MSILKRLVTSLFVGLMLCGLIAPSLAFAQSSGVPLTGKDPLSGACDGTAGANSATCQSKGIGNNPITDILVKTIQIILLVTGVASVIVIIISGFRYITSSGDPNSVNGAKNGILFAVIGLMIALSGQFIISYVIDRI